jgi:prepilin-type N-terminal cleavage/methylation domain-containing protein
MITTTGPSNVRAGFTLFEVMVAVFLGTIMLGSAFAVLLSLNRGSVALTHYTEMNAQSRQVMELFGRDMRMTSDVSRADDQVLVVDTLNHDGNVVEVIWDFDTVKAEVVRTEGGVSRVLLRNVEDFNLNYFTLRRDPTNHPLEVKEVQLEVLIRRPVLAATTTNHIVSARFMMRNRKVSN